MLKPTNKTKSGRKGDQPPVQRAQSAPPIIDARANAEGSQNGAGKEAPWWEKAAVLIGIALLIANWFQGCQTEKAADIAKDTLVLDERPWVGLMGNGHVSVEITKDSPIKSLVDIQNFGKTPALDERGIAHLTTRPIQAPMPDLGNCTDTEEKGASPPVTLMPTAIYQYGFATDAPSSVGIPVILTQADIDLLNGDQVQLYLYGCIWYRDTFHNPRKTEWCLQYIPSTKTGGSANRFSVCPTHNHAW